MQIIWKMLRETIAYVQAYNNTTSMPLVRPITLPFGFKGLFVFSCVQGLCFQTITSRKFDDHFFSLQNMNFGRKFSKSAYGIYPARKFKSAPIVRSDILSAQHSFLVKSFQICPPQCTAGVYCCTSLEFIFGADRYQ